jgi:hypothetical protein
MLTKKNVLLSVALLGTLVIAGAGVVGCHRPPMLCGGGCHGEGFPKYILEKLDSEVAELELTAAQQEGYQEIRAQVEGELVDIAQNRKAFFQEVKTEMDKDSPDVTVVADLLKAHSRRFPERMTFFVGRFMDFYAVLNTEQKGKIVAHLKAKLKKFEAFRELVCD